MPDTLAEICAAKRVHVAAAKARGLPDPIGDTPRGFRAALDAAVAAGRTGLVAEIKKASPSRGLIRADFDPAAHARDYAAGKATCLSVLTDIPYFQGHDDYLRQARAACALPALRKDFTVDPWQAAEGRALGADAILLIAAALSDAQMAEIEDAATAEGLDVLVEVHDAAEMARVHALRTRLVGVNNRDLRDFTVDLARTEELAALAPAGATLIAESGIFTPADLARMAAAGVRCALVGESLMRQADVAAATRALLA